MFEYKEVSVSNDNSTKFINDMNCFGWELFGTSTVGFSDFHMQSRGNIIYNWNTHSTLTKLTFRRDTNIDNYDKLVELEKAYEDLFSEYQPKIAQASKKYSAFLGLFIGMAIGSFIFNNVGCYSCLTAKDEFDNAQAIVFFVLGLIDLILFIVFLVLYTVKRKKSRKEYAVALLEYNAKSKVITDAAKELLTK